MARPAARDGAPRAAGDGAPPAPSRRRFLAGVGVASAAAVADAVLPATEARAASVEELAREHADDPALLLDVSRCTGCGACVTACKLENDLEWRRDQPSVGPDAELASSNFTAVRAVDVEGTAEPSYLKRQCLHCLEPACASACPVRALRKDHSGAVTYDLSRCIGCRYCLIACPFGVPTFEWDRAVSGVIKCNLCFDGAGVARPPACAAACPVDAIRFGRRAEMLAEAHRRIDAEPERYEPHVYGETEAGGTSVLYVSDVPFVELGLPAGVPDTALPGYTWPLSRLVPPVAGGLGVVLMALYARRRRAALEEAGARGDGDGGDPGGEA